MRQHRAPGRAAATSTGAQRERLCQARGAAPGRGTPPSPAMPTWASTRRPSRRCWPVGKIDALEVQRLFQADDEGRGDLRGRRGRTTTLRNTEIFGFEDDRINSVEVYFGWDLDRVEDKRRWKLRLARRPLVKLAREAVCKSERCIRRACRAGSTPCSPTRRGVEFYGGLFGWEFDNRAPSGSPGPYYVAQLHGLDVAAIGGPPDGDTSPFWNTYTAVESADRTVARVQEAGGDGDSRTDGHSRCWSHGGVRRHRRRGVLGVGGGCIHRRAARERARHVELQRAQHTRSGRRALLWPCSIGTLSTLGWATARSRSSGSPATATFSRRHNPEFARRSAPTASPGFADAVARLIDRAETAQSGDARRIGASRSRSTMPTRLRPKPSGSVAKVIVPPFDTEPVRMTVLADPQGAVFTASKYMPPE